MCHADSYAHLPPHILIRLPRCHPARPQLIRSPVRRQRPETTVVTLSINANGELEAGQRDMPPTVYFDHWALRIFSKDDRLATRLTTALEARGGTLALSWANLAEFAKVTGQGRARQAEAFIEANLPRIFLVEADPFVVIEREDRLLAGDPPLPPHGDQDFLRALVALRPATLAPFTARDLLAAVQSEALAKRINGMADTFISRVATMRDEAQADPIFQSALRRSAKAEPIQRGTRFILRELVRALILDKGKKITRNDAFDFFHAVVPVAYCEFVLLDKYWETQVGRVRCRFQASRIPVPMAAVFSRTKNGLDRFARELERA